ncbi:RNA binding protein, heterogenous nuclear RNP-K like protein [Coemansia sp. RSA 2050]|nr:RNA binding protein, heterogenous nuclear RNP-K like protein [Coemansia sp. RSA 2050]
MSDESKAHDLGVLSATPNIESQSTFALAGDDTSTPNPASLAKSKGGTPSSSKKKRGRKASVQNNRPPSAGPDSEDINFHVEAGWSEDEADTKEHPAKRVATNTDKDAVALAKRATGPLSNFTVRAVVTRKDVEVVFGQEKDKQALLEAQTGTKIEIITGNDDPDIVVDRVLSIKGPIDGVAAAYKGVVDSLHKANAASTTSAATVSATAVPASAPLPAPTESPSVETSEASKDALPTDSTEPDANVNANANVADETAQLGSPAKEGAAGLSVATAGKPASNVCVTLRLLVPHRCVGSIMGHNGRTINNIRDVTSVSIHTSEATLPISTERIVEINGSPDSIQKAIVLIAEALTRDMASYTSADLYVPAACLPSAMTVEINNRKRKDGKRMGNADQHSGNRGQAGNRGSGARSGGGYGQNRGQGGSGHNAGNSMSGGMNNRGDRYGRHGERQGDRHADRNGGRNRGPNSTSQVNRVPVGGGGGNNRPMGSLNHHNNNSGGYRTNSQLGPSRNAAPPTLNYGGYAVPAPTLYPTYVVPNATAAGHIGGVVPPVMRYGGAVGAMGPGPTRGAYGDNYNGAPSSYQYPAPAAYGYGVAAAAQGMYSGASDQSANAPYSQAYPERNNRQQMPQSSMPMGGSSGSLPMGGGGGAPPGAAGQTIQQIYVPGDKIGAVIGRRGETINEIRRTTSANVDIQDSGPGAKQRLIIITGGYEQVRSAYYMIKNKVDMARPAVHS